MAANKKRKNEPRKPSGIIYAVAYVFGTLFLKIFYGFKIDRREIRKLKGPMLVLSNHQSNLDFLILAATMYPVRLNYLVSSYFFRNSFFNVLLYLMGAISKKQFSPDTGAIKNAMKVISRGGKVAIFPEGQVCYSGRNCDIDDNIAKLIKKLGVMTVVVEIRGDHLTMPKWANGASYRGRIETRASVLLTPGDIKEFSVEEIAQKTLNSLTYNEYEWQRGAMIKYRPKFRKTEGLDKIIHSCPACRSDYAIKARDNALYCEKCGYEVKANRYGFFEAVKGELVYDNPADWYTEQKERLTQRIKADELFPFSSDCTLYRTVQGKGGYAPCGEGVMALDWSGISFTGTRDGEPFAITTNLESQTNIPFSQDCWAADIHSETENYGFAPADPRQMIDFIEGYAIAHKIKLMQN